MHLTPDDLRRIFIYLCAFGSVTALVWWVHAVHMEVQARTALGAERRQAIGSFVLLLLAPVAAAVGRWLGPRIDLHAQETEGARHVS